MAKYSKADTALAVEVLTQSVNECVRLIVTHKGGNMYRVDGVSAKGEVFSLTYSLGVCMGKAVRSRDGVNVLSVGGGGYSKPYYLVTTLLHIVGVEDTHTLASNYVTL